MLVVVNQTSRRRKLVFYVNVAKTPEQIMYARVLVADWLRLHPEDGGVKRAGRQLQRSEDQLRQVGEWH